MESIVILGSSREHAIKATAKTVFDEWKKSWCLSASQDTVSVSLSNDYRALDWDYRARSKPNFTLSIDDQHFSWSSMVYGTHVNDVPDDATSLHIVKDSRRDFAKSLMRALNREMDLEIESKATPVNSSSFSMPKKNTHIVISFEILDERLSVQVPLVEWVSNFSTKTDATKPLLSKIPVENGEAEVSIELDLGSHELDMLQNLAVGDILTSTRSLDSLFSLKVRNREVAKAFLGKSEQHKAVYLQPITKKSI